jgi:hypothetical protein
VRLRCGILLAGLLVGGCAGAPGGDVTAVAGGSGSPVADRPHGARPAAARELLQGEVVAVEPGSGRLELVVHLAGTSVPRRVHERAVLSVDGGTEFVPGGGVADLRPGDQVLVRADRRAGGRRAVEVTLVDLD